MKKFLTILTLGLMMLLSGCIEQSNQKDPIQIEVDLALKLNNEFRGIDFEVTLSTDADLNKISELSVDIYYKINPTTEDLDYKLQLPGVDKHTGFELEGNKYVFTLENVDMDYEYDYMSAYASINFKYNQQSYKIDIQNVVTKNLYELALVSEGAFADEIIEYVTATPEEPELPSFSIELDASLNGEKRGFNLDANIVANDAMPKLAITYGLIYTLDEVIDLRLSTTGSHITILDDILSLDLLDVFSYTYASFEYESALDTIYARAYVTVTLNEENHTIYSEMLDFSLYELAQNSEGAFAAEIIQSVEGDHKVHQVTLELDLENYQVTSKPENTDVNITTDYIEVTVTVSLTNDLEFGDQIIFKVNGKTVGSSLYTIDNNTLTYTFDDPNWSDIY